ncbi:hypothetical protein FDI24_gp233 [Acidovorax phage ACP17]|uniref:Uncharacterized protein n=1 Tax=Acidovorax phage ACP17 TaxID=2010329 RepID=A0A218M391_9CAUD|nr:hypothetical protein FDI24_gp233 [Acidovorax phage ACP17]ASD50514.1 hypothetical protein [Acidovorax phage ACP17]
MSQNADYDNALKAVRDFPTAALEKLPEGPTAMSQKEAQTYLDAMSKAYEKVAGLLEDRMAEVALAYNLYLYLGDYGSGRTLLLQDDEWTGKSRGEWMSSSEAC